MLRWTHLSWRRPAPLSPALIKSRRTDEQLHRPRFPTFVSPARRAQVEPLFARLGFTDATADVVDAVLEEAGRFSATVLAPLNSVGDEIGCVLDQATGEVTTPPGFKQAYDQFVDGGWTGWPPRRSWAAGLPHTTGVPLNEMINAANLAWGGFPAALARRHRSVEQHGEAGSARLSSSR
ncbi:hypothetical protein ACE0DR_28830 [Azotobacter sp. CWF10]